MEKLRSIERRILYLVGAPLVLIFGYWLFFLNHVDVNEIGIAYDSISGNVWIQRTPGWYRTWPTVKVVTFSTLPTRVEIISEAKVVNVKFVRFNPDGADEFIRLQGLSYWTSQQSAMTGYAFSGHKYTFLDEVQNFEVTK